MEQGQTQTTAQGATTGYEAELWGMADALRGSMDAAEYKHVVLGLIFLKYISDAFEEVHTRLESERAEVADDGAPSPHGAQPGVGGSLCRRDDLGDRLAETSYQDRLSRSANTVKDGQACGLEF